MLSSATRTRELEKHLNFTTPYITLPLMIFSREDHPYIKDIGELHTGVTAVVDGHAIVDFLEKDWPDLPLLMVKNVEDGLRAVTSGRADHYIDTLLTTSYNIQRLGFSKIKVAGETPYTYSLGFASHKKLPTLHQILQKGLDSISEEERSAIFNKWRSIHYEHDFDYTLLWKMAAIGFVVLGVIFHWNRRLAAEINDRKRTEKRLLESESKSHAMSEAIHDGLVMIDEHARVMYWNQAAENLFGITAEEAMGKNMHNLISPKKYHADAHKGLENFAITGKGPVVGKLQQLTAIRKDGSRFPAEIGVSSFQNNNRWYAVGTIRDITERIESQETVARVRTELQQIFDNTQVGIIFIKDEHKLYRCNQRTAEILGYESPQEMIGMDLSAFHLSDKHFEEFAQRYHTQLAKGIRVVTEYEMRQKNGRNIWCSLAGNALDHANPPDITKGVIWALDDISEKKAAQEALQESKKRVKTILESINTGTMIIDPQSKIILDVNPVAAKMIGLPTEQITGKRCHQFTCPCAEGNCPITDDKQSITNEERLLLTASGVEIPILKTVVPILLDGKKELLESFVDLSQQKKIEQALQENLNDLERFYRMAIDREEKMIDLKTEINALLVQTGHPQKYTIR